MIEARAAEFEKSPVGRYTCTGNCLLWCASPSLCGWYAWGRPDEAETRVIVRLADQYRQLAPRFDAMLDTREINGVNPASLAVMTAWVFRHRNELKRRVRMQTSIIRMDSLGMLFAGILPALGDMHPFRVSTDPLEAFRAVAGEAGVAVANEVEEIIAGLRSIPRELQVVRATLAKNIRATIKDAATELGTSPRSLQRMLAKEGTSFHYEVTDARFVYAKKLLVGTEGKIDGIAERVGLSKRSLTLLFRAKTGLTPTEWRKREVVEEPV